MSSCTVRGGSGHGAGANGAFGGLGNEGTSRINSPCRRAPEIRASFTEAFGDKENIGAQARSSRSAIASGAAIATGSATSIAAIINGSRCGDVSRHRDNAPVSSISSSSVSNVGSCGLDLPSPRRACGGAMPRALASKRETLRQKSTGQQRPSQTMLQARAHGFVDTSSQIISAEMETASRLTFVPGTLPISRPREQERAPPSSRSFAASDFNNDSTVWGSLGSGRDSVRDGTGVCTIGAKSVPERHVSSSPPPASPLATMSMPSKVKGSTSGAQTCSPRLRSVRPRFISRPRPRRKSVANVAVFPARGGLGCGEPQQAGTTATDARTTGFGGDSSPNRESRLCRGFVPLVRKESSPISRNNSGPRTAFAPLTTSTPKPVTRAKRRAFTADPADPADLELTFLPRPGSDYEFPNRLAIARRSRSVYPGGYHDDGDGKHRLLDEGKPKLGCLKISLENLEAHGRGSDNDDDILTSSCDECDDNASVSSAETMPMSPSATPVMLSPEDEACPWWGGGTDMPMSSMDEINREPNAREKRRSGTDPVARMLLSQSDSDFDVDGIGYGSDNGSDPDDVSGRRSVDQGVGDVGERWSLNSKAIAFVEPRAVQQGLHPRSGDGGRASPTPFAAFTAPLDGRVGAESFLARGRERSEARGTLRTFGSAPSGKRGRFGGVEGPESDRLFRPIAFHRPG